MDTKRGLIPFMYHRRPTEALLAVGVFFAASIIRGYTQHQLLLGAIGVVGSFFILACIVPMGETSAFGHFFPPRAMGEITHTRHLSYDKEEEE